MTGRTPPLHQTEFEPLQVTVREAGRLLAYDARTITRLVERGELQIVGQGKLRRIPLSSLYDFQRRNINAAGGTAQVP